MTIEENALAQKKIFSSSVAASGPLYIVNSSAIPADMLALKQWVNWKYEERVNKMGEVKRTKTPYQPNGYKAKTNDPSTWSDFDTVNNAEGFNGIGFCFAEGDGLVGIDLDHCIDSEGVCAEWASDIIDMFPESYLERSPSMTGYHILCQGAPLKTGTRKWLDSTGQEVGFEIYNFKSPRYFTVTGDVIRKHELIDAQDGLEKLYQRFFIEQPTEKKSTGNLAETAAGVAVRSDDVDPVEIASALLAIPADEYHIWINVGMALKSAGLPCEMWEQWSATSPKYEPGECDKKWQTFRPEKITYKSIFSEAAENGWKNPRKGAKQEIKKLTRTQTSDPSEGVIDCTPTSSKKSRSNSSERLKVEQELDYLVVNGANAIDCEVAINRLSKETEFSKQALKQSLKDKQRERFASTKVTGTAGNALSHQRWPNATVPFPYLLTDKGLLKTSDEKPTGELIAGPMYVKAKTSSLLGGGAGLLLEYENIDGDLYNLAIPRERLHQEPSILAQDLAGQGYYIRAGKEKEIPLYIGECRPKERRFSVAKTGWAPARDDGKLVFVLPSAATDPDYHFQPERHAPSSQSVRSAGTLQDWINNVFVSRPYPLFAVLLSLSAPLLKFAGLSSCGVNFFGPSSSGKTTLAQIAASVWGSGCDPGESEAKPYINRWNTTRNGGEGLAEAFNHIPLCMDELGSLSNPEDFAKLVYDICGGQGKTAMTQSRTLKPTKSWMTLLISTGEYSAQQMMESPKPGKSKHAKAGAMIRVIDLAIQPSIFKDRNEVDVFKRNSAKFFGTLGPAFIKGIVENFTSDEIEENVRVRLDAAIQRLIGEQTLNPMQQRALKTFAICEVAGQLLTDLQIIPNLKPEQIRTAVDTIVADFMPASAQLSDGERAVNALREYILQYRDSRFKKYQTESVNDKDKIQIAGQYDSIYERFYFYESAFKDATGGEIAAALKLLKERNLLVMTKPQSNFHRITVDGKRVNVYAVKAAILEDPSVAVPADGEKPDLP